MPTEKRFGERRQGGSVAQATSTERPDGRAEAKAHLRSTFGFNRTCHPNVPQVNGGSELAARRHRRGFRPVVQAGKSSTAHPRGERMQRHELRAKSCS
jgi:hypothetical protein